MTASAPVPAVTENAPEAAMPVHVDDDDEPADDEAADNTKANDETADDEAPKE